MRITTDDGPSIDQDVKKLRGISQAVNQKAMNKSSQNAIYSG